MTTSNYIIDGEDQFGRPIMKSLHEEAEFIRPTPTQRDLGTDEWGVSRRSLEGPQGYLTSVRERPTGPAERPFMATDHRGVQAAATRDLAWSAAASNKPIPKEVLLSVMEDPIVGAVVQERVNIDLANSILPDELQDGSAAWVTDGPVKRKINDMLDRSIDLSGCRVSTANDARTIDLSNADVTEAQVDAALAWLMLDESSESYEVALSRADRAIEQQLIDLAEPAWMVDGRLGLL